MSAMDSIRMEPMVNDGFPYPDPNLTKEEWAALPARPLPIFTLVTTQSYLNLKSLLDPHRDGQPIDVVEYQDVLYLHNGHHRMARAHVRGERTILARVLTLNS